MKPSEYRHGLVTQNANKRQLAKITGVGCWTASLPTEFTQHIAGNPQKLAISDYCRNGVSSYPRWVVVDAVTSEPVSADFPVMQGKYREFS